LQARPERFRELVERYSEHRDAVVSGDFGSWSTREPNPFPARMLRLQALEVGKIGAPIETPFGFEIIQRTEVGPREQYAVRAVRLPFEPSAADAEATSRASVAKQAEALANTYAAEPQRFADATVLQWQSGRGVPALEVQVRGLEIGAVAKSPVQTEFSFQISQRVAAQAVEPVRYQTELPEPQSPDIEFHLTHMESESLRALLRATARRVSPGLRLESKKLARVQELCDGTRFANPDDSAQARAAVQRFLADMKTLLGPEGYELYFAALQRELTSVLLETDTSKR
jgi:parvulin-like peptidyl-prolyl isomerase